MNEIKIFNSLNFFSRDLNRDSINIPTRKLKRTRWSVEIKFRNWKYMAIVWHASSLARAQFPNASCSTARDSKIRWIPQIAITPCRQGNFEGFEKNA